MRLALLLFAAVAGAACQAALEDLGLAPATESDRRPEVQPPGELDPAQAASDLEYCVAEINRLRATLGLPALRRSPELEAFAAEGAATDSAAARPHEHFKTTRFPWPYTTIGENEVQRWSLDDFPSVREIVRLGLWAMWSEGPGGGHYENMIAPYDEVGCGIYVEPEAREVTVVEDFRERWRGAVPPARTNPGARTSIMRSGRTMPSRSQ